MDEREGERRRGTANGDGRGTATPFDCDAPSEAGSKPSRSARPPRPAPARPRPARRGGDARPMPAPSCRGGRGPRVADRRRNRFRQKGLRCQFVPDGPGFAENGADRPRFRPGRLSQVFTYQADRRVLWPRNRPEKRPWRATDGQMAGAGSAVRPGVGPTCRTVGSHPARRPVPGPAGSSSPPAPLHPDALDLTPGIAAAGAAGVRPRRSSRPGSPDRWARSVGPPGEIRGDDPATPGSVPENPWAPCDPWFQPDPESPGSRSVS